MQIKSISYLFVIALINIASLAKAQQPSSEITSPNYTIIINNEAAALQKRLLLSSDQKDSVISIYTRFYSSVNQLKGNNLTAEQRGVYIQQYKDTRQQDMKRVLTSEQFDGYTAVLDSIKKTFDSLQNKNSHVN